LSAAARLQQILPDAVLVGGTASALDAAHRFSGDAQAECRAGLLDLVALVSQMTDEAIGTALARFDELCSQPNDESALQQLQIQLANPMPYDLEGVALDEYKNLAPRWHDWQVVKSACARLAVLIFEQRCEVSGAAKAEP
jgi:hypothetical protein